METRKFAASVAISMAVFFGVLFIVFANSRPSIESIPLDWGWIGFFFILTNGFLFSCIIVNKKNGILNRLLLTVGLGFGLTFVVMILLGVLWQITLPSVLLTQLILLVVLTALAVQRGLRVPHYTLEPNLQLKKHNVLQAVLILIIGVLAFAAVYDALSLPPTEWDSLAYGVNYARIIFQNNHIPLIAGPSIGIEMSAPYPPGMQLSATFLYVLAGSANDFYYRMLSPIFSLATLLVVYKFTRQITKSRTAGVFAVSALTLIPFYWQLFIQDTYLMSLTFMLTMTGYFFYKSYSAKTGETQTYEVLGVLFCGFAALTSYIGLLAFGVPLLYAVHKRLGLKKLAGLFGLGILVLLPWYLRNLVLLGNPVYPFAGGKYLDPLLRASTSQSFQQYMQLPEYAITSNLCKIAAVFLLIGIVFFSLSKKRKDFPLTVTLYLLLVSVTLMAVYVAFPRYIIIAIPTAAVFFGFALNAVPKKQVFSVKLPSFLRLKISGKIFGVTHRKIALTVFVILVVLSSAVLFQYVNTVKPIASSGESRTEYITNFFQEGDAWQWIGKNTPTNTKIATYDIKEYYLNRTLFLLDGKEAAPLYHMDNITEAIKFLKDNGVGFVLSVPWASSRMDVRMPQAYNWSIITRYLGANDYLPPVFIDKDHNGTAVYHVGALTDSEIKQFFPSENNIQVVAPLWHQNITLDTPNTTNTAACYIAFPIDYITKQTSDYGAKNITVSFVDSNGSPMNISGIDLQLWNERIPFGELQTPIEVVDDPYRNFQVANSNFQSTFTWHIDKAWYFTIRVFSNSGNFTDKNVTLDIVIDSSINPAK